MKLNYRPDIDGLRAIAVLGVVLYHAKLSFIPGGFVGVDIFFVISGYLITSILIREQDQNGRVDFYNFWARRTRRLLPSALVVIISALIVSYFVQSKIEFFYAIRDSIWASIYLINWTKLISSVQYFDEGGEVGPFLHYWSLAVEEQFYIFLALVFAFAITMKRIFSSAVTWSVAQIVIALIVASSVLSFIANLYFITEAQPIAFFSTPTRIWQLGLGAAIGLIERNAFAPTATMRNFASWVGLALMLSANIVLNSDLAYPGIYAVLPSLGAGLFIFAFINGANATLPLPSRIIATRLPVYIGMISYSLYLWHWPVFVLWESYFERWEAIDIIATLLVTLILSISSYLLIENPIRFSKILAVRPKSSLIGFIVVSVVFVIGAAQIQRHIAKDSIITLAGGNAFLPDQVRRELPRIYRMKPACHLAQAAIEYPECIFGAVDGVETAFIFGDSHMAHWFPALDKIAADHKLKLFSRTKSACASVDIRQWHRKWKREYTECAEWRNRVLEEIKAVKPRYVFIGNSSKHSPIEIDDQVYTGTARLEALRDAEKRIIDQIRSFGSEVIFIKDTPWHTKDPFVCLVANPLNTDKCRTPESEAFRTISPWSVTAETKQPGVHLIDMNEHFCRDGFCYMANDDFILVRDTHHISRDYSEALSDALAAKLDNILAQ